LPIADLMDGTNRQSAMLPMSLIWAMHKFSLSVKFKAASLEPAPLGVISSSANNA
jgi:hypothetical protein